MQRRGALSDIYDRAFVQFILTQATPYKERSELA